MFDRRSFVRERAAFVLLVATAAVLTGCSPSDDSPRAQPSSASSSRPAPVWSSSSGRIGLLQRWPGEDDGRYLTVEADGSWHCTGCAGDNKTTRGRLTAGQQQELSTLLQDPALQGEVQAHKRFQASCRFTGLTTLQIAYGLINVTTCPDEVPPPAATKVIELLIDVTPADLPPRQITSV